MAQSAWSNLLSLNSKVGLIKWIAGCMGAVALLTTGCGERENARSLNLDGLQELVCAGRPYLPSTNSCGARSIWFEADSGWIAYITIYGVESEKEAEQIKTFVAELKRKNRQDIPVSLTIYSDPRSKGRDPSSSKILHKRL